MVLELLFSLLILAVVIFIAVRVLHSIAFGLFLIFLVFIASYLLLGASPDLQSVPIVGQFLKIPKTIGEAINALSSVVLKIDVISTSRDSENNLLITVTNKGIFEVSDFTVFVDSTNATIKNKPKDPLKSKETTTMETDWKGNFTSIIVQTKQTKALYRQ